MEDPDVTEMKKNCNNREYVLQAVKGKGKLLEFAAPEFHDDEEVVRTKSIYLDPMTLDEAITRMEALGHSFFLYLDEDDDEVSVAYKRLDGAYGVIQAENKLK